MLKNILVFALLGLSTSVFAGDWQVKMGASVLAPQNDDNGTIANTTATVSNEIGANSNMRCDSFKSHMIINKLSKFL